jgi:hypothetical protein
LVSQHSSARPLRPGSHQPPAHRRRAPPHSQGARIAPLRQLDSSALASFPLFMGLSIVHALTRIAHVLTRIAHALTQIALGLSRLVGFSTPCGPLACCSVAPATSTLVVTPIANPLTSFVAHALANATSRAFASKTLFTHLSILRSRS